MHGTAAVHRTLRYSKASADTRRVNPVFLTLNLTVIVCVLVVVVAIRLRRPEVGDVELPSSIRPDRSGEELTDLVTEWARTTGVLSDTSSAGDNASNAARDASSAGDVTQREG